MDRDELDRLEAAADKIIKDHAGAHPTWTRAKWIEEAREVIRSVPYGERDIHVYIGIIQGLQLSLATAGHAPLTVPEILELM